TRRIRDVAAVAPALLRLSDEAVHLPAVDVGGRIVRAVRPATVDVRMIDERLDARAEASRIGNADALRNTVRTGVRAEVGVERSVLLHDHDDVPDVVDAAARRRR